MNKKKALLVIITGVSVMAGSVIAISPFRHGVRVHVTTVVARLMSVSYVAFPDVDMSGFSSRQIKIINLARVEYKAHPVSYDSEVLKYTQGHQEAWCADFISWVMLQSEMPLVNPNSGGWRIPGVYTLRDYFMSKGRYAEVGTYIPRPGDVAFYIGKHTFDLFSTEHATIVLKVDGNTMTMIGGNEGGRLRLDTQAIKAGENSLVGFGKL